MADDTDPTPDERPPAAVPGNPLNDPNDGGDADSLLNPARTGLGDAPGDEAGTSTELDRTTTSRSGGAGAQIEEPPNPS